MEEGRDMRAGWWIRYTTHMDSNGDPCWIEGVHSWHYQQHRTGVASELSVGQHCFSTAGIYVLQKNLINHEHCSKFTSTIHAQLTMNTQIPFLRGQFTAISVSGQVNGQEMQSNFVPVVNDSFFDSSQLSYEFLSHEKSCASFKFQAFICHVASSPKSDHRLNADKEKSKKAVVRAGLNAEILTSTSKKVKCHHHVVGLDGRRYGIKLVCRRESFHV